MADTACSNVAISSNNSKLKDYLTWFLLAIVQTLDLISD